jgi:hypothetical protein
VERAATQDKGLAAAPELDHDILRPAADELELSQRSVAESALIEPRAELTDVDSRNIRAAACSTIQAVNDASSIAPKRNETIVIV